MSCRCKGKCTCPVSKETARGLREKAAQLAELAEVDPAYSSLAKTVADAADAALKRSQETT